MRSGWNGSKSVRLLAHAQELDRLAGDVANRQRRAAACVAVHLGQDDARQSQTGMKVGGRVDRVLAGHGVGDEENFAGVEQLLEPLHLAHQLFVDVQPPGRVDDERVAAHVAGLAPSLGGQALNQRGTGRLALLIALVELGFDGFGHHLELLARRRAIDVHRDQHGPVPAFFEPCSQLAGGGRFAGALQAGHQNDRRRLRGEFEARRVFAQHGNQLVADNLDHLLGGRERGEHFGSHGLHADLLDQVAHHVQVDVGLEQRHANLAQGLGDVLFGERALAAKGLEGALQFVCQVFKHSH